MPFNPSHTASESKKATSRNLLSSGPSPRLGQGTRFVCCLINHRTRHVRSGGNRRAVLIVGSSGVTRNLSVAMLRSWRSWGELRMTPLQRAAGILARSPSCVDLSGYGEVVRTCPRLRSVRSGHSQEICIVGMTIHLYGPISTLEVDI
jgi:hypothetical protein